MDIAQLPGKCDRRMFIVISPFGRSWVIELFCLDIQE